MGATRFLRGLLCCAVGLTLLGPIVATTAAEIVRKPAPRPAYTTAAATATTTEKIAVTHGRVYLLRGLANVFSRGMDALGAKLNAKGIPARVTNHSHWRQFADVLVSEYKSNKSLVPLVIIGHSLGADAAVTMGNYLAEKGVPVRLVVAFDGVAGAAPVVNGVAEVINYYKPNGYGRRLTEAEGYKGTLVNVDLSERKEIYHLNIDKAKVLHDEVIAKIEVIFAKEQKSAKRQ